MASIAIGIDTDTPATPPLLESGCSCGAGAGRSVKESKKETAAIMRHGRTAHNASSSSLRKKRSDLKLVSRAPYEWLRQLLANLQEVLLGTKLFLLFPAVPLAVVAHIYRFSAGWVFALSLLGLTPLAERISFLTEQITFYTGGTGGLLNATCGNATELIIAVLAVKERKMQVVKLSLLGSVLSDLLLVLGTSLFSGGVVNVNQEQYFDRKQADVNCLLLFLSLLCHTLPMMFRYVEGSDVLPAQGEKVDSSLQLSRAGSLAMLFAYFTFLIFQLWSHRQFFEAPQEDDDVYSDDVSASEEPAIGFWSSLVWLVGMSLVVALLSEYVVGTIEDAADSWGLSVSFVCIILLPIVSNAAEHAGAVIFAVRNKLVPVTVIVAWAMGIEMDLSLNLLETACLALSIIVASFALQDGSSHYIKGLVLVLSYFVIAACFFVSRSPPTQTVNTNINMGFQSMTTPSFTY